MYACEFTSAKLHSSNKSVFPYMDKKDGTQAEKYVYIPLIASHYLYWELISEFLRWHTKANGSVKNSKNGGEDKDFLCYPRLQWLSTALFPAIS